MFWKPCTIYKEINDEYLVRSMSHSVRYSMKGSAGEKVGCKADWRFSETVACLKKCPLLGFTYWMHIRVWVGLSADVRWQWQKLILDCEWGWFSFLCELTVRLTCHLFTNLILLRVTSDNLPITLSQLHGIRSELWILWSSTQGLTKLNNSEMSEWWSRNVWMG